MAAELINFVDGTNRVNANYNVTNKSINNDVGTTHIFSVKNNQDTCDTFEYTNSEGEQTEFDHYNAIKMQYIDCILASRAGLASAHPSIYPSKISSIIDQINEKSISITEPSMEQVVSYCFNDIQNILNDNSKTDKEKEKAIQVVLDKMKAVSDEATKKMEVLQKLMKGVAKIASILMHTNSDVDCNNAFSGMQDILSKINTNPSDLSGAKTSKEVEELGKENFKNILGTNKNENKEKIADLNNEIKKQEAILKDNNKTDEEKLNAKIMIASLEVQKEIYSSI